MNIKDERKVGSKKISELYPGDCFTECPGSRRVQMKVITAASSFSYWWVNLSDGIQNGTNEDIDVYPIKASILLED